MILWMLWSIGFVALVAVAAAAAEKVAGLFNLPRRHIWIVAMIVGCLAPAVLAVRRPAASTEATAPAASPAPNDPADDSFIHFEYGATQSTQTRAELKASPLIDNAKANLLATGLWMALSLCLSVALLRSARRMHRTSATWQAREFFGRYHVLVSPDSGPAVIGFNHPRIVIPAWALTLERSAQELILTHETEHIRAHDPRTLLGAGLLLVLFPWNAALWWMIRRLRLAMELDCDARVIRATGGPRDYGMVLLAVGERYARPLPFAASLAAPRTFLERRIDAMTATRPRKPMIASLPFIALAFVATTAATRVPRPAPLESITISSPATPALIDEPALQTAPVPPPTPPTPVSSAQSAPPVPPPMRASAPIATLPIATAPLAPLPVEVAAPSRAPLPAASPEVVPLPVPPSPFAPTPAAPMPAVPTPAAPTTSMPAPVAAPARPPRPAQAPPNRERMIQIVKATMESVVRGQTPANYVVLLFDGDDQFVWGVSGVGGSMIAVGGDTLSPARRREYDVAHQLELSGSAVSATAGGGGRGGGAGRGGAAPTPRMVNAAGELVSPAPSNRYSIGTMSVSHDATGKPTYPPVNDAPGMARPADGSSGIDGIRADQIAHVDIYHFTKDELGPSSLRVLAVHLVPGVKKP